MATKKKSAKKVIEGFIQVSAQQISDAKLGGFKKKKPSKPKVKSRTVSGVAKFKQNWNVWAEQVIEAAKSGEQLRKEHVALSGL
jgi:hypothetical protein